MKGPTDVPDTESRIREIRAELEAIAPVPDGGEVSPLALARHLVIQAQWRWTVEHSDREPLNHHRISAMCAEFAAATALYALADAGSPELGLGLPPAIPKVLQGMKPGAVAEFIRDCWEDGGSVGEFLFEYLGPELHHRVTGLLGELMELTAAAKAAKEALAAEAVKAGG